MNILNSRSRSRFRSFEQRAERDNSVARYHRVAIVEAVLSIRERRQKVVRNLSAAAFMALGLALLTAGVLGWI